MRHTLVGDELCSKLNGLRHVQPIVRFHHERLDGSGYPDGLHGSDIPILAQVLSVVDVFDALTTDRPYRDAVTADAALDILEDEARRGWRQSRLVSVFADLVRTDRLGGAGPRV
jgi:putative two-component system response regulator